MGRQSSAGCCAVSVTARGAYNGRLQLGADRRSFSGRLDLQCQATNLILRPNENTLRIELRIGSGSQSDQVLGLVTDGIWVSTLAGDRAVFNSKTNPAPWAGSYTLFFPGNADDPALPSGDGFGAVRVLPTGHARFVGTLADGARVSASATLSRHGLWPVYIPLYLGKGSLVSWLAFTHRAND